MGTGAADSWYHEKESAWLYGEVAAAEPDPARQALSVKLAAAAEDQAARWLASRPQNEPQSKPVFTPALRVRIVAHLVRRMGPRRLRAVLAAMKLRGLSVYSGPPSPAPHAIPTSVEEVGKRHASAGGKLRAAVFGASDGLVSTTAIALFAVGIALSLSTGRGAFRAGKLLGASLT